MPVGMADQAADEQRLIHHQAVHGSSCVAAGASLTA
jgi:hypothetical protein